MKQLFHIVLLLAMLCMSVAPSVVLASASGAPTRGDQTVQADEGEISVPTPAVMGGTENCRSAHPGKLLAVIVPCIRDTMEAMAVRMTAEFSFIVMAATSAFVTLVVVIFGIQMLTQEADLKKDGFSLLLKIGVVLYFTNNFGGHIPDVFTLLNDLSRVVSNSLSKTMGSIGSSGVIDCSSFDGESPWRYYDCFLGALFGFAPDVFVGVSLISIVPAALGSGQFGVMIFMAGLAAFLYFLRLVIRVTYIYLMAVVALSFMIVVSPLFIPLLLIKRTESYFSRWLHAFMSLIGQPVLVLAFMAFAIAVIDVALTNPKFGILAIATSDEIKEWQGQQENRGSTDYILSDCPNYFTESGKDPDATQGDQHWDPASPLLSCASQISMLGGSKWSLDFGSDEATITQRLFFGLMTMVLICYLLLLLVNTLLSIAAIMFGGAFYLREATENNPFETGLNNMTNTMQSQWKGEMSRIQSGNSSAIGNMAGFAGAGSGAAIKGFLSGTQEALSRR